MLKFLPGNQKISLIKRVEAGEKVSRVCKEAGISRTIFYKWHKEYKSASLKEKDQVFSSKRIRGKRHWNKFKRKVELKVVKTALKTPASSPKNIAKSLNLSTGFVWNTLKKNDLNTKSKRILYIERNGTSLINPKPVSDKITMIRRFEQGDKISNICHDFSVSRTIFYRWLKRYQKAADDKKREVLESLRPKGEKHWRFIPGVSDLILKIVIEHPEFSFRQINNVLLQKEGRRIVCNTQVYNILKRLNLNTYQRRLAYANSQTQTVQEINEATSKVMPKFGRFEIISVIPPPLRNLPIFKKRYLPIYLSFIFSSSILIGLIKLLSGAGSIGSSIGILFSLVSFIFGMFFFLYSFKYYVTIAAVLSFSRQKDEEGGRNESFFSKLFARVTNRN
ncbi:MAG: transposase, partial [Candidatus Levybacteria bacterium]|nr:transposase [Candidatus Levybacteria bacterium]